MSIDPGGFRGHVSAMRPPGFDFPVSLEALPRTAEAPVPVQAWPRIEAPSRVVALRDFDVVVGLSLKRDDDVAGGPIDLPFSAESPALTIKVEISTGAEVVALDGWSRELHVEPATVQQAEARFRLSAMAPTNPERASLTTLEVRYSIAGVTCGIASRPLAILADVEGDQTLQLGKEWSKRETSASPVVLVLDEQAPDLTLEILKPDGHPGTGSYRCHLLSPHALTTPPGPFDIELGNDARSYAQQLVDNVRTYTGTALLALEVEGVAQMVARALPPEFFAALAEVGELCRPEPPSVLIVSAEPYVPWELAWLETPLDPSRPQVLGAQADVGRWLREKPGAGNGPSRPAIHPIGSIDVAHFAAMAAWYTATTGMRRLPKAEDEARALQNSHGCVLLPAKAEPLRDLLNANLQVGPSRVPIQAWHFAGHGSFDATTPDASALYLEDGKPLRSNLFGAAKYGGERQPLLFLNACMLGIGGENLGITAGFPGNSLRGGFGAMLGALWEIDDQVAHDIALEFWKRALPPAPAKGEPIGRILRDLRARYVPDAEPAPIATYLSYVYYGHPRLQLQRAQPVPAAGVA
jgi:hypothetical protein